MIWSHLPLISSLFPYWPDGLKRERASLESWKMTVMLQMMRTADFCRCCTLCQAPCSELFLNCLNLILLSTLWSRYFYLHFYKWSNWDLERLRSIQGHITRQWVWELRQPDSTALALNSVDLNRQGEGNCLRWSFLCISLYSCLVMVETRSLVYCCIPRN